jgi:hypothetical protein
MKKIDYEIADFRHSGVNDTAVTKNDLLLTPIFFVCGIVQHNLPMFFYRYSYIPFKGGQSVSNIRSNVTAVSDFL